MTPISGMSRFPFADPKAYVMEPLSHILFRFGRYSFAEVKIVGGNRDQPRCRLPAVQHSTRASSAGGLLTWFPSAFDGTADTG